MLTELLSLCAIIQDLPSELEKVRLHFLELAVKLRAELESHLVLEETQIFPSLGTLLPPDAQSEVVRELRARRQHVREPG
jgi:iron-sulfur cluster repair protein YtfE (RIC family)